MPSIYWNIWPEEAYTSKYCYQYEAQGQFFREAEKILMSILKELEIFNWKYDNDSKEKWKALWMLMNDSTHTLLEINTLLKQDKHSIAWKLFRTIDEILDLSILFYEDIENKYLDKWYNDEIIQHSEYRKFMWNKYWTSIEEQLKNWYKDISKFTHRTYISLRYSYIIWNRNQVAYDFFEWKSTLTYRWTPSMYISLLGIYIQKLKRVIVTIELIEKEKIESIWEQSLEKETLKRNIFYS